MPTMANLLKWTCSAVALLALAGCSLFTPLPAPETRTQRLSAFPVDGLPLDATVNIHWDAHQVPFIEAETDHDAAFALGLVHAHLRLGQMEIFRRVAQGRLAESVGPLAVDIDHGLRIIDFGRAAAATEAAMSPEARAWTEAFVAGINAYQERMTTLPHEFALLGIEPTPWRVRDVLTFGRLAGTDVNWLVWANLLRLRQRPDWPELWTRLVENGSASVPSFDAGSDEALLHELLAGLSRSGSNSLAVAGSRTASGAALMANDPHLGIYLPNVWLLAGVKSPSQHAVGLMIPGLPFFALGRNPWIAWGGTNMRAASSELIDLSALPADAISSRQERIAVRWWFDRQVTVRDSSWGPVLSDVPLLSDLELPPVAVKWTGHAPSDEIAAMLAVTRARNFAEFRAAFAPFAVPGQNMLYADGDGNIGQVMAVELPRRNGSPPADVILQPDGRAAAWSELAGILELPASYNPAAGFLASANNRPTNGSAVQIGYFFSPDDRVLRMAEIMESASPVTVADLQQVQTDTYMASSVALRDVLVAKLEALDLGESGNAEARAVVTRLADWDGRYDVDSAGAVAFESFRAAFADAFYRVRFGDQDWAAFANVARIKTLLREDVVQASPEALRPALEAGLEAAARAGRDYAGWGGDAPHGPGAPAGPGASDWRPLPLWRVRRRRQQRQPDEDGPQQHRRAAFRALRLQRPAHFRPVRSRRQLVRLAGRPGRLVQQRQLRRPGAVVAGRRIRPPATDGGDGAPEGGAYQPAGAIAPPDHARERDVRRHAAVPELRRLAVAAAGLAAPGGDAGTAAVGAGPARGGDPFWPGARLPGDPQRRRFPGGGTAARLRGDVAGLVAGRLPTPRRPDLARRHALFRPDLRHQQRHHEVHSL